ncbi:MAG: PKD domain-containing protein, partial [Microscillaceae bacterium]|nr:PKD domain-containing protein [Microscillaceae bacterium]
MVANFQNKLFVIGGETENNNAVTLSKTESFDPGTGNWQNEVNLKHPRHGTQAIVSGNGIFVAAGSPNRGGGSQKNMEVFGLNNPTGMPLVASNLVAPANVYIAPGATASAEIAVNGGNSGIFIKSMTVSGPNADLYQLVAGNMANGFIKPNTTHNVQIKFNGTEAGQMATLLINHGKSGTKEILINNTTAAGPGNPPVVSNPGMQVNLEGDVVNLPIIASDPDAGQTLSYSATNLPPSLTINPSTGLISGILDEATGTGVNGAFVEENGRVIMQIESAPLANGWTQGTDGSITFYQATTNNLSNPAGGGILNYDVQITTPGVYRFLWRSKINQGSSNTESNDNWLKLPNDANVWFFGYKGAVSSEQQLINALQGNQANVVFPKGSSRITAATTPEGAGASGFFKIYMNALSNWPWIASTSDFDPHQIYVWFVNPGTYTLQVSNRSAGHAIEKMALYKINTYTNNYSTTTLTNAPESPRVTVGGEGSAGTYAVTVTATDNGSISQSASQTFT